MFMERFLEAGFERLYPVNPREEDVLGVEAYPAVGDISEPIDLALILAPPRAVKNAVRECATCGVKGIAVITGRMGDGGEEEVREIVDIARDAGARIIGPNCLGIYCSASRLRDADWRGRSGLSRSAEGSDGAGQAGRIREVSGAVLAAEPSVRLMGEIRILQSESRHVPL
jgi:predicted CoA-binding protein